MRSALDSNAFSGHHGPWVPDEFREHTGMVDLGADGDHRTYRIISKESAEPVGRQSGPPGQSRSVTARVAQRALPLIMVLCADK